MKINGSLQTIIYSKSSLHCLIASDLLPPVNFMYLNWQYNRSVLYILSNY